LNPQSEAVDQNSLATNHNMSKLPKLSLHAHPDFSAIVLHQLTTNFLQIFHWAVLRTDQKSLCLYHGIAIGRFMAFTNK